MTLDKLIEELLAARDSKGGGAEVIVSGEKKTSSPGITEVISLTISDVIFTDNSKKVGILASE